MGNTVSISLLLFVALGLTGCESLTASQKVLGKDSYWIDAAYSSAITPGIYRIKKKGELSQVCQDDFKNQSALKQISLSSQTFAGTVKDDALLQNLTLNIPGMGLGIVGTKPISGTVPESVDTVTGYTITRATVPTGDFASYAESNVATDCRKILASGHFLYVDMEARASQIERDRVGGISGGISGGPHSGDVKAATSVVFQKPNVTFGVSGDEK